MSWVQLSITDGFYQSESLPVSAQTCTNMYPNVPENSAISQGQLYSTPGLVELERSGDTDPNRGAIVLNDKPYFINGSFLYRLDRTFDAFGNELFSLVDVSGAETISGTTRVSVAENGEQICIVEPGTGNGWIYTEAGGLVKITDPDFTGTFPDGSQKLAEIVVYIDGYFLFTTASKNFFVSELNDGLSYNALDFGTAEADPDVIRSAFVYKNQVYILGSETIEVFQNIGGAGFPFQRIQGFVIPKGITAPFSIAEYDGSFAFIGQGRNESPKVYIWTGDGVAPISTTPIDTVLQGYTDVDVSQAFVWNYSFRGATFIGWSLPNNTIVHESKASRLSQKQIWHERRSIDLQNKSRWRINSLVTAYGRQLVGDSESGIVGEINNDVYQEYGNFILREVTLPVVSAQSRSMFFGRLEIEAETGITDSYDLVPQIRMSYSDDAKIYTADRERDLGEKGDFSKKIIWNRLGRTSKFRVFRFRMSDPTNFVLYQCSIEVDG